MSKRNKDGSWTVPQEQVNEFLYGKIDYTKLIMDCLVLPQKVLKKQAMFGKYTPSVEPSETVEAAGSGLVRLLNKRIF